MNLSAHDAVISSAKIPATSSNKDQENQFSHTYLPFVQARILWSNKAIGVYEETTSKLL